MSKSIIEGDSGLNIDGGSVIISRGLRPMKLRDIAFLLGISPLVACSGTDVQSTKAALSASVGAVQAACTDAMSAAQLAGATVKGGAANTVASISGYVIAGCATAQAVAALAASSSSVQWLGQQQGALQALAAPPAVASSGT